MDIAIWIMMCLLACYGVVEVVGRVFYGCRVPKGVSRGCLVVPVGAPEQARRQMEYYLSFVQWHGLGRMIVFVAEENETVEEAFRMVLGGVPGVYLCTPAEAGELIEGMRG